MGPVRVGLIYKEQCIPLKNENCLYGFEAVCAVWNYHRFKHRGRFTKEALATSVDTVWFLVLLVKKHISVTINNTERGRKKVTNMHAHINSWQEN